MYINTITLDYPLTLRQVRKNIGVSFSSNPIDADLALHNHARVQVTERPKGDVVTEGTPAQQGDGTWAQTWEVRSYTDAEFTKALERVKTDKRQGVNRAYEDELNAILKNYPDVETKTWDKQEQEARAWTADNTVSTPLLAEIANARGMALAELVPRVIAKADAWVQLSGAATGKRQALESSVEAATTIEEVEAIVW